MRVQFVVTGRKVKGSATLTSPGEIYPNLSFSGGFFNDDILQLSYRSESESRKQLGAILLKLSDDGTELTGYYTGYSPSRSCLITGKVTFRKN